MILQSSRYFPTIGLTIFKSVLGNLGSPSFSIFSGIRFYPEIYSDLEVFLNKLKEILVIF